MTNLCSLILWNVRDFLIINNTLEMDDDYEDYLQDILPLYYEKLFPHNSLFRWLSYGSYSYFLKREIAFILTKERYIRHVSFQAEREFMHYIIKRTPMEIDIGGVFNIPPRDHGLSSVNYVIEKELVFDIDMNDYDEIRTCCNAANVCNQCWKFLAIACKIMDAILREDFDFQHILWVFSGRRGIHCWVCDKDARQLSDDERNSILGYINLVQGGTNITRRVKLFANTIHSSIERALKIIEREFVTFIIREQNVLGTDDGLKKFLNIIADFPRDDFFEETMFQFPTSIERWNIFNLFFDRLRENNTLPNTLRYLKEEIMLHFLYPRLDAEVTIRGGHLLKSPFCVHPKTGKIAIPFCPKKVMDFDFDRVPTIDLLLHELDDYFAIMKKEGKYSKYTFAHTNIRNTSLCMSFNIFQNFLQNLEISNRKEKQKMVIY